MQSPNHIPMSGVHAEIRSDEIHLFKEIGSGQYGKVYQGTCRGHKVAVKKLKRKLDQRTLDAFKSEVEIMCRLINPNAVALYGACTEEENVSIVTEFLEKGDLQALLRQPGTRIDERTRMRMARDAAKGMHWLHSCNPPILHRDLKTSNLLVGRDLTVKVCDFGLSQLKPTDVQLRDTDRIPGTPLFMAPEVMQGGEVTEKADVYSFGLVLWEIYTGVEPFGHHNSWHTFKRAVVGGERPPLRNLPGKRPDVPAPLQQLMQRCWAPSRMDRPSFEQIYVWLESYLIDLAVEDATARELWKRHFHGRERVPFDAFRERLSGVNALPEDGEHVKCLFLRAAVADPVEDVTMPNAYEVDVARFGHMLRYFGPLQRDAVTGMDFCMRLHLTLQHKWFHGEISQEESERRLREKGGPNYFLIRFSSQPGCFTISRQPERGAPQHQRISHSPEHGFEITVTDSNNAKRTLRFKGTLPDFYERVKNDLKLIHPCPGSKYEHVLPDDVTPGNYVSGNYVGNDGPLRESDGGVSRALDMMDEN